MQRSLLIELNWDYTSMSKQDMENAAREILYKRNMRKLFIFLGISLVVTLSYFKYFRKKLDS